jgi:hypothetical protein
MLTSASRTVCLMFKTKVAASDDIDEHLDRSEPDLGEQGGARSSRPVALRCERR